MKHIVKNIASGCKIAFEIKQWESVLQRDLPSHIIHTATQAHLPLELLATLECLLDVFAFEHLAVWKRCIPNGYFKDAARCGKHGHHAGLVFERRLMSFVGI